MTPQTASSSCGVSTWPGGLVNSFARTESLQGVDALSSHSRVQLAETKRQLGMCHAFFLDLFPEVIFKAFQGCQLHEQQLCKRLVNFHFLPEINLAFNTFCDYLVGTLRKNFQKVGRCQSSAAKKNVCGEHSTSSRWKSYRQNCTCH